MINIEKRIEAHFFLRWMSVAALRVSLAGLRDTDLLYPNRVGNLAVERNGKALGYVDFNAETMTFYTEEARNDLPTHAV